MATFPPKGEWFIRAKVLMWFSHLFAFFYLTRNDLNQKMWQTNRV